MKCKLDVINVCTHILRKTTGSVERRRFSPILTLHPGDERKGVIGQTEIILIHMLILSFSRYLSQQSKTRVIVLHELIIPVLFCSSITYGFRSIVDFTLPQDFVSFLHNVAFKGYKRRLVYDGSPDVQR